jgi:hypothetical protein
MTSVRWLCCLWFALVGIVASAQGQLNTGDVAPEFPPGKFSDSGTHSLERYRGKVVVLVFIGLYSNDTDVVPELNKIIQVNAGKPLVVLGIGSGRLPGEVASFINVNKPLFPIFTDTLALMEREYIGMRARETIFVVGPDGKIAARRTDGKEFDDVLAKSAWRYNAKDYPKELQEIVRSMEFNDYDNVVRPLKPLRNSKKPELAEPAKKLWDDLMQVGNDWKTQAAAAEESDPVTAFDLYSNIVSCFRGEELAKDVPAKVSALRKKPAVKDELAARIEYEKLAVAIRESQNTDRARAQVAEFAKALADRFPDTPTGKKCLQIALNVQAMR